MRATVSKYGYTRGRGLRNARLLSVTIHQKNIPYKGGPESFRENTRFAYKGDIDAVITQHRSRVSVMIRITARARSRSRLPDTRYIIYFKV